MMLMMPNPARPHVQFITTAGNIGLNAYTTHVSAGYNGKRYPVTIVNASRGAPDASSHGLTRGAYPAGLIPYFIFNAPVYGHGGPGGTANGGAGGQGGPGFDSSAGLSRVANNSTVAPGGGGGGAGGGGLVNY